ncbi:Hypothetical predicted protein [Olea europaea subsp. europaea]|uniref:Uncharacterized protein n=1 Tax=Olea europaea subsp. europaea TaxID=158383 RepID=A0A8S0S0F5_OLEEU|nr:Hypothetical predicted protein [Olea europaea subsp. europaea]
MLRNGRNLTSSARGVKNTNRTHLWGQLRENQTFDLERLDPFDLRDWDKIGKDPHDVDVAHDERSRYWVVRHCGSHWWCRKIEREAAIRQAVQARLSDAIPVDWGLQMVSGDHGCDRLEKGYRPEVVRDRGSHWRRRKIERKAAIRQAAQAGLSDAISIDWRLHMVNVDHGAEGVVDVTGSTTLITGKAVAEGGAIGGADGWVRACELVLVGHVRDASSLWQGSILIFRHFYAVSGTRCASHDLDAIGTQSDFQAFLGHVRDASWPRQGQSLIFRQFWAVSGTRCIGHVQDAANLIFTYFLAISWTRCAGNVRDTSGLLQGCNMISGPSRTRPGRILAAVGTQLDFQAFVGSLPCPGHVRQFWVVSGTRCGGHVQDATGTHLDFQAMSGCIQAAVGTLLNFQAFLCNFRDSVSRPYPGCVMAKAGTEPNFQAILGSFMDTVCRPCPGYGRDASRLLVFGTRRACHVQDAAGTHHDFHVFLCCFLYTVCRQCSRLIWAAARMQPDFQAFLGHVRDTFRPRQEQSLIFRPSPGRILATAETRPDFQAFLGAKGVVDVVGSAALITGKAVAVKGATGGTDGWV